MFNLKKLNQEIKSAKELVKDLSLDVNVYILFDQLYERDMRKYGVLNRCNTFYDFEDVMDMKYERIFCSLYEIIENNYLCDCQTKSYTETPL